MSEQFQFQHNIITYVITYMDSFPHELTLICYLHLLYGSGVVFLRFVVHFPFHELNVSIVLLENL